MVLLIHASDDARAGRFEKLCEAPSTRSQREERQTKPRRTHRDTVCGSLLSQLRILFAQAFGQGITDRRKLVAHLSDLRAGNRQCTLTRIVRLIHVQRGRTLENLLQLPEILVFRDGGLLHLKLRQLVSELFVARPIDLHKGEGTPEHSRGLQNRCHQPHARMDRDHIYILGLTTDRRRHKERGEIVRYETAQLALCRRFAFSHKQGEKFGNRSRLSQR